LQEAMTCFLIAYIPHKPLEESQLKQWHKWSLLFKLHDVGDPPYD